ncbi:MAG: TIM barrel protein [Oscillospiraceae bacterium]|nr:TIM barrel protein [Oscillospiraceae bacterium]
MHSEAENKMAEPVFGPAGTPDDFPGGSTEKMPGWLASIGLSAFEYQCGRGVRVGEETARSIGRKALENDIFLSLHAPYYINLANPDAARQEKNVQYVISTVRAADAMGASRVVVHSGTLLKRARGEALKTAMAALKTILRRCDGAGFGHISLCPETMGKTGQLGTLEEVLSLCQLDERLIPCVDFGHLYARSFGAAEGPEAFLEILDTIERALGVKRAKRIHVHFSKIAYTKKGGELRHLTFDDPEYGPEFLPLASLMAARDYCPVFICESAGTQSRDALRMKEIYFAERKRSYEPFSSDCPVP